MITETMPTTRAIYEGAITALADSLRGDLIQPGDAGYEVARGLQRHDRQVPGAYRALS